MIFYSEAQKSVSGQQIPKSYLLSIRRYSWHKNEIKRIRRGCYRGKNFQDSTKEKLQK
jgi:hypothetical protein